MASREYGDDEEPFKPHVHSSMCPVPCLLKSTEDFAKEQRDLDEARTELDEQIAAFVAMPGRDEAPTGSLGAIDFGDEGMSSAAKAADKGRAAEEEAARKAKRAKAPVTMEKYNELFALCAKARELRPIIYLWTECKNDGLEPDDASFTSLEFLLSKVHQLENRTHIPRLPYFECTAPPKTWIRHTMTARSATRKLASVSGEGGQLEEVEQWLRSNPQQVVKNAFKTATAVVRGKAVADLSSAKARTIVMALHKSGVLKSIRDKRDGVTAKTGKGAGKAAKKPKKNKNKKMKAQAAAADKSS